MTKGIVSSPEKTKNGFFLIDAVFNKGFSGGLVFAIKDGVPNFEIVGMAKSAASQNDNIIVPEKKTHEMLYNPTIPYEGKIFVQHRESIKYGITYVTTIETIQEFLEDNKELLESKGYHSSEFILNKSSFK